MATRHRVRNWRAARNARRRQDRAEIARLRKPLADLPNTHDPMASAQEILRLREVRQAERLAERIKKVLRATRRKILATGTPEEIAEMEAATPFNPTLFLAVQVDPRTRAI